MSKNDLLEFLEFSRKKTLDLLDGLGKLPNSQEALGWRPGPGRAHVAWQIMHIAATDDRHVHVRMRGGQPQREDYVKRFAGGSVPDDDIPPLEEIRDYLLTQRKELLDHMAGVSDADFEKKPNDQAPWTYREWMKVLGWHEAHHQGQAHLTLNLFKARQP
jgi:hypothetical protein